VSLPPDPPREYSQATYLLAGCVVVAVVSAVLVILGSVAIGVALSIFRRITGI
jgi:hypothetical protein